MTSPNLAPPGFTRVATLSDTDIVPWWPDAPGVKGRGIALSDFRVVIGLGGTYFYSDGSVDTWALITAQLNTLNAKVNLGLIGNGYVVSFNGSFLLSQTLVLPANLRGISFQNGVFYADTTSPFWTSSTPLIDAQCRRCKIVGIGGDCGKVAAGFLNSGGQNHISSGWMMHYQSYGWNLNGAVGGTLLEACRASQWQQSDPEYLTQANWTASGIWSQAGDDKIVGNIISINGINVRFSGTAGTILFRGNHLFNGSTFGNIRPKNIVVESGVGSIMVLGNYLDNGENDLHNDNVAFEGNQYLLDPANATCEYVIGLYYNGTNHPTDIQLDTMKSVSATISQGTVPFFKVLPDGGSFLGDFTHYDNTGRTLPDWRLAANLFIGVNYRNNDRAATIISPNIDTYGAHLDYVDATTDITNPPNAGSAGNALRLRGSVVRVLTREETQGELSFHPNDTYTVRLTTGNDLTFKSNGIDRLELTSGGTFRPVTDDAIALGTNSLRFSVLHVMDPRFYPDAAVTISVNGGMGFEATSDTITTFKHRGTDGTTRVIAWPLGATNSAIVSSVALTPANDDILQRKAGAWTNRTIAQVTADLQGTGGDSSTVGFRGLPTLVKGASYTCILSDVGKRILKPAASGAGDTYTIDSLANVAWPDGAAITIQNGDQTNSCTLAVTTQTAYLGGTTTTGNRTLAPNGLATAVFNATDSTWTWTGVGLT